MNITERSVRLDKVLTSWSWLRVTTPANGTMDPPATLDLTAVLPKHGSDTERGEVLDTFGRHMAALAETWSSNTDIPRQIAAMGSRAAERGHRDVAEQLFR